MSESVSCDLKTIHIPSRDVLRLAWSVIRSDDVSTVLGDGDRDVSRLQEMGSL